MHSFSRFMRRQLRPATALRTLIVAAAAATATGTATAQFGFPGAQALPEDDFTWTWGRRGAGRGLEDFSLLGSEGGFRCDLKGQLRPGSRMSRMDMMRIERELREQMQFVRAAVNAMNDLDAQGELAWATLECEKPERGN